MVTKLLSRAIARRAALRSVRDTNMFRLFNGRADGVDGLVIEQFGPVLVVQVQEGRCRVSEETLRAAVSEILPQTMAKAAYRKQFLLNRSDSKATAELEHRNPTPWIGEPCEEEFDAFEGGLRYRIRPYDGFSVGLFLDARDNRRRVRERASGKRVLNTFAYTCGFSIAAAAGGAAATVNVDVSKRYLEWGKRNFVANGFSLDGHLFYCCDVFDGFRRLAKQGRVFDLIILDPPTFARVKGAAPFVFHQHAERLLVEAFRLLDRDGAILLSTNHRGADLGRLEGLAEGAAGDRRIRVVERPPLPADFAGDLDLSKSLWFQRLSG